MYIQGQRQGLKFCNYKPSLVILLSLVSRIQYLKWKAQKFDAHYLMSLYKKAGTKYFMSMGVHHDNFDLLELGIQSLELGGNWDLVKISVGMWKIQQPKSIELKVGMSDHLWISYKWFSTSKGSDTDGPLAGVYYDGADPKNFEYYGGCEEVFKKMEWNENGIPGRWKKHWFDRIKDLVDNYEPDLLYCDGQLPFEEYGLSILAHLYNKSANKNGGKTQTVYTSKRPEDSAEGTGICVFDVERGVVETIWPLAWQTDTCIGDWHYNRERVGKYKSPKTVIDLLVDIVSRNGNLMLNFPLPSGGMLDSDELIVLDGITKWMAVNSEAIYATRPWRVYGEGHPSAITNQDNQANSQFNENKRRELTHEDVRFTTRGNTLYTFFMGWPEAEEKQVMVRLLGNNSEQMVGSVENVELLGYGKVDFKREEDGLKIILPSHKPCEYACALKISGSNLI